MQRKSLSQSVDRTLPWMSGALRADLAQVIERLAAAFEPDRIFVFGSQARGEATDESDIDLLMVVGRLDEPAYRVAQRAYNVAAPHGLQLEIVVMSREEFDRRRIARSSLPATVLREGVVLYAA